MVIPVRMRLFIYYLQTYHEKTGMIISLYAYMFRAFTLRLSTSPEVLTARIPGI